MGVTDADIERHFGEPDEERCCAECVHFHFAADGDTGVCGKRFEETFDDKMPGEAGWECAKWAASWVLDNIVDGVDGIAPCGDYEE